MKLFKHSETLKDILRLAFDQIQSELGVYLVGFVATTEEGRGVVVLRPDLPDTTEALTLVSKMFIEAGGSLVERETQSDGLVH